MTLLAHAGLGGFAFFPKPRLVQTRAKLGFPVSKVRRLYKSKDRSFQPKASGWWEPSLEVAYLGPCTSGRCR